MTETIETKSHPVDVAQAFEDFARAFEAFKETNDERLRQIEGRFGADVVTEEKLARIDAALDHTRTRLAAQLRTMYDSITQQPVPDRFAELIAKLDSGDREKA